MIMPSNEPCSLLAALADAPAARRRDPVDMRLSLRAAALSLVLLGCLLPGSSAADNSCSNTIEGTPTSAQIVNTVTVIGCGAWRVAAARALRAASVLGCALPALLVAARR